jgi:DNA-binding CsgD family transcriptional regulator
VVNFAALDYSQPEKNRYKYKLEGFTSKWIPLGTTPEVTFSNLSPGRYVFRVRGSNSNGIWNNDGAALTIFIKPPFWKTWWFKSLCLALVLLLFYSWHLWRMKSFRLKLKTEEEMAVFFKKYNISNREKEVVNLVLKGKSNKQIEDELFISLKTVTSHIYNIYKKLGVKNRVEMIRKVKGIL